MSNATFNGIEIANYAWAQIGTKNEIEIHKIPRADGSIVRRRGGGVKTIVVHAWVIKDKRFQIEQYFDQLASNFTSALGDLVVNGQTYSNCVLDSVSPSGEYNNWSRYTITFIKSG